MTDFYDELRDENAMLSALNDAQAATIRDMGQSNRARRTVDEDESAYLAAQGAHVVRGNDGKLRTNAAADGPRYKGLGNAWAVACVRPIAQRIAAKQMEMF